MNGVFLYTVSKKNNFQINTNSLIDLYLPIIGHLAHNFYMLLANDVMHSNNISNLTFSLQNVCEKLNCSLDEINQAKRKLEAINLIETFLPLNQNKKNLLFVLNSPLNFYEFISHPKYKALLIKEINLTNFQFLEYKYLNDVWEVDKEMLNVSATFESIFDDQEIKQVKNLDFSLLYKNLLKLTSINIVIPEKCKEIIENIYIRHNLSIKKIEQAILDSTETNTNNDCICNQSFLLINLNKIINEECKAILPTNSFTLHRDFKLFENLLESSDEQKIILDYKTFNAETYIMTIFKNKLLPQDRKIISHLKNDYRLSDEIINTLIDFVLFRTKGKLNKKYIYKVAKTINGLNINACESCIKHFKDFVHEHSTKQKKVNNQACGIFKL